MDCFFLNHHLFIFLYNFLEQDRVNNSKNAHLIDWNIKKNKENKIPYDYKNQCNFYHDQVKNGSLPNMYKEVNDTIIKEGVLQNIYNKNSQENNKNRFVSSSYYVL